MSDELTNKRGPSRRVARVLAALEPDVVALQETDMGHVTGTDIKRLE